MRQRPHGIFIIAVLMLLLACASLLKTYISTTVNNVHIDWRQVHASEGIFLGDLTPTASLDDEDSSSAQSSFHHARLRKRQVRRSAFQKALKTGQKILSSFDGPARQKPRAAFDKTSDLEDWGWKSTALDAQTIRQTLGNFAAVLEAKGISVSAPTMRGVRMIHAKETVHGGVKYPATGGTFDLILDPDQGILVPSKSYGPACYVENKQGPSKNLPPNTPLTNLRNWADVAFLAWLANTTPENRGNLRYILNINALNPATVDVVSEALQQDDVKSGTPPAWPGHVFAQVKSGPFSKNNAYAAVLGTPNVLGTGWLVAQRQDKMGSKRLGAITVFDSSGFDNKNGAFQLSILVEVTEKKS